MRPFARCERRLVDDLVRAQEKEQMNVKSAGRQPHRRGAPLLLLG